MYDWRIVSPNVYVDINSISLTEYDYIYELWEKCLQVPKGYQDKYGKDLCLMTKYYLDMRNKKAAIVSIIIYNKDCSQCYFSHDIDFEDLDWFYVPPGSNAAITYDIIKGTYMPPKVIIWNPIVSVLLSVITGFVLTYILGHVYLDFWLNPVRPTIIFSYTIHPIYRYALNIQIAHFLGHSFWRRLLISSLICNILFEIINVANSTANGGNI